jgi:hypothetical protein
MNLDQGRFSRGTRDASCVPRDFHVRAIKTPFETPNTHCKQFKPFPTIYFIVDSMSSSQATLSLVTRVRDMSSSEDPQPRVRPRGVPPFTISSFIVGIKIPTREWAPQKAVTSCLPKALGLTNFRNKKPHSPSPPHIFSTLVVPLRGLRYRALPCAPLLVVALALEPTPFHQRARARTNSTRAPRINKSLPLEDLLE